MAKGAIHRKTSFGYACRKQISTTSPRPIHPAVLLALRPLGRLLAMFLGRRARLWWQRLPEDRRGALRRHLANNAPRYGGVGTLLGAGAVIVYHDQRLVCPYTGRLRFMLFSPLQMEENDEKIFMKTLEELGPSVVAARHPDVVLVRGVANRLVTACSFLQDREWKVVVVDSPEVNCYCLSSGHIVMYRGMLAACGNPAQLAAVLAHEMSHVVLQHHNIKVSHHLLSDLLRLPLTFFAWCLPSSLFVSLMLSQVSHTGTDVSITLPFFRELESEADILGLYIMSMACYDAREASCLWRKFDQTQEEQPLGHWLATHPSHQQRYRLIDAYIPKTEACRKANNCPRLSPLDPRRLVAVTSQPSV